MHAGLLNEPAADRTLDGIRAGEVAQARTDRVAPVVVDRVETARHVEHVAKGDLRARVVHPRRFAVLGVGGP